MNSRLTWSLILIPIVFTVLNLQNPVVTQGDSVVVEYTGWIGSHQFNTNKVNFTAGGNGEVIDGLSKGVIGLRQGEVSNLSLPAYMAFGEWDSQKVFLIPVEMFKDQGLALPEVGQDLVFSGEPGEVINVTSEYVSLDTNHELAGEALNMTVKVLKIN